MKNIRVLLSLVAMLMLSINSGTAAPEAELLPFWNVSDEQSTIVVPHTQWQALLDRYLITQTDDGVNLFDYEAVSVSDKQALKTYLAALQKVDPRTLNKNEQLSYWINFYNALTVDVVLDEYPVESIKDIRFITSLFGPWDKNLVKVMGQRLSLNDIEHRILRPIWQDPRIHFVVNCASIGCPNLQAVAFTAENTEALMEQSAQQFINHQRGVELTSSGLVLSSIFDWYASDFGDDQSEVVEYLSDYYQGPDADQLESETNVSFQYNWQLNQAVK